MCGQQTAWQYRVFGTNRSRSHRPRRGASLLSVAAAAAAVGIAGSANAATIEWVGPAGSPAAFEVGSNWAGGSVPTDMDDARINNGGIATVTTFDGKVQSLKLGSTAAGSGTIDQSGGSLRTSAATVIGEAAGSSGTLNISGGLFESGADEFPGGNRDIFFGSGGTGTLNMTGGALDALTLWGGNGGNATLTQSGGIISTTGHFVLGNHAASTDVVYNLSGGSAQLVGAGEFYFGHISPATINLSGSGELIAFSKNFHFGTHGVAFNGNATVNMTGGLMSTNNHILLGDTGTGTINMSAGTIQTVNLNIGQHSLNSSAGFGNGTLNQSGGSVTAANEVYIGQLGTGVYDLSGGTFTGAANSVRVGNVGTGTWTIRGTGEATVGRHVVVGGNSEATGVGTLTVTDSGKLTLGVDGGDGGVLGIGSRGNGTMTLAGSGMVNTVSIWIGYNSTSGSSQGQITQTGGTMSVADFVDVGQTSPLDNFYEITGGTLTIADSAATADEGLNVARFSRDPSLEGGAVYPNGRFTVDGTATVNIAGRLSNSLGWTPTSGGSAGVPLPGGTGLIEVKGGTLTAASFVNGGDANVAPNSTANYNQTGGTASLGHVTGTGSMTIGAAAAATAGGVPSSAMLNVNSLRQAAVTIGDNALVTVAQDGTAAGASNIGNLTITGTGKLDIKDNKLITNTPAGTATAGDYDGVQGYVQSARNGGAWNGPSGITTSLPTNNGLTSIGVATGAKIANLGPTQTATFAGQTITADSTVVMYTYGGDANLDGIVSGDDYTAIDFNILVPGADGWVNGDFNYDGIISGDDYTVIDFNILAQGAPFPTSGSAAEGVTAVPEPASLALLGLAGVGLAARRVRRR